MVASDTKDGKETYQLLAEGTNLQAVMGVQGVDGTCVCVCVLAQSWCLVECLARVRHGRRSSPGMCFSFSLVV